MDENSLENSGKIHLAGKRSFDEGKIKTYKVGTKDNPSHVILIPKAWLEIFCEQDEGGSYILYREIDKSRIILTPHPEAPDDRS